ncbi:hypothetical protein PENTCL1PPCAC_13978, partial [Pristionchus entomophagus]
SNDTEYLHRCIPDVTGRNLLCEELESPSFAKSYVNISGSPRILWALDIENGIVLATNSKTMNYTNKNSSTTEIRIDSMFVMIECQYGDLFSIGDDHVKCGTRKRRNFIVKPAQILPSNVNKVIEDL